jgi:hypothetical protein
MTTAGICELVLETDDVDRLREDGVMALAEDRDGA